MMQSIDVAVVGTGAAGVSATFPIAAAGLSVLLIDPDIGKQPVVLPEQDYLDTRRHSSEQWPWLLGRPSNNLRIGAASSPKFRVPTLAHVFDGFADDQQIETDGFSLVGSLASGGLTTAWGAGVARFSAAEMGEFPFGVGDLAPHYRSVAARIGLSGGQHDDVSAHFGLDDDTMPPLPLDRLGRLIDLRYGRARDDLRRLGFEMGRARLAVLSADREGRRACDQLGLCLWGCPRQAIYTASHDLAKLRLSPNVQHRPGILVERLEPSGGNWAIIGTERLSGRNVKIRAKKLVLAAGTIATTKLILALTEKFNQPVRLISTPTATMALFFPASFGSNQERGVGLAQHWYVLNEGDDEVCGGLFPTTGLPVSEFVSRAPVSCGVAIDIMRWLLPSVAVGNLFVNGRYSNHAMLLTAEGTLRIRGGFHPTFETHLASAAQRLTRAFRNLGAVMLPGSFSPGAPGSDAHYAGTLPMRVDPGPLETSSTGELFGSPGLYVADGSVLPSLPAKSHTLTIMANADRIGNAVARDWGRS